MSMKTVRINVTIPGYIRDYLDELAEELGSSRSEILGEGILYVSQHEADFKSQFDLTGDEEEEEEEEE